MKASPKRSTIEPAEVPALRQFVHGYLYKGFTEEYDSAEAAAREFRSDAEGDEFVAVATEWKRFCATYQNASLPEIKEFFKSLGSGWSPSDPEELAALTRIFGK